MPPVLGWAAVTGDVAPEALLLFLIIFAWTPPHFWSLALYRTRGLREGRAADAAGDARRAVHAAADRALHAGPRSPCRCCRSRSGMSGCALPRRGAGARRRVPRLRGAHLRRLQRRAGAARRSATRSSISRRCSRRCWSTTTLALSRRARAARGACSPPAAPASRPFKSTDVTGATSGASFALTDHNGKPRTLADFRGKAVVVFFGFTQCPDVCPTTLAEMQGGEEKLGRTASACRCCS